MESRSAGHYCVVHGENECSRGRAGRHRRGLVLGAGGVLGGYWSIGALRALEEITGWDPRRADVLVGTSVGSLLSSLLAAGVRIPDLVDSDTKRGPFGEVSVDPTLAGHPRLLPFGSGSPELLARSLMNPLRPSLLAWCTALFPAGWASLHRVRKLVEHVVSGDEWPSRLRVVATDYSTGQRRSFEACDRYQVEVPDAVAASCAMPAYFAPIDIDGRRYVDGAVTSVTNADLLLDGDLDWVCVLAPMAASGFDRPASPIGWLERLVRLTFNRALRRERRLLEAAGIAVTVLAPDADDLAAMGANLMNARRRADVLETAQATTRRQLEVGRGARWKLP